MTFTRLSAVVVLALAMAATACAAEPGALPDDPAAEPVEADELTVVVHRTAACDCCGAYEDYLESQGFGVDQRIHDDLVPLKRDLGVPDRQRSCHTNEIAGYVAEGHVPAAALMQLVEERPAIDGIALGGMPPGSPGMPGEQDGPLVVMMIDGGEVVGEFGRF